MHILDLGEIEGPMLIFGGPNSNLHALEALLKESQKLEIPGERIISTGDVVAYCADAQSTVERVREMGINVLAGNCEKQLGADAGDCGCGFGEGTACELLAIGWYVHARVQVSNDSREWMASRPDRIVFKQGGRRFAVIHGGASAINRFLFPVSSEHEFEAEIAQLQNEVGPFDTVLAGHSGIAFTRIIQDVEWINAGVVGMPQNDGNPQTRYVVLSDGRAQIRKLNYDYKAASQAMQDARLTQGYHEALLSGYWPSQEVLPPVMRRS